MKKKALILGLALTLAISQAALAVAAGSITVSDGSSGPNKTDLTVDSPDVDSVTVIDTVTGNTSTITGEGTTVTGGGETSASSVYDGGSATPIDTVTGDSSDLSDGQTLGSLILPDGTIQESTILPDLSAGQSAAITPTGSENQDLAEAPAVSVPGGPATGAVVEAAPEVTQEQIEQQTAILSNFNTSLDRTFSSYKIEAASVLQTINDNPTALAALPSSDDLSHYVMLTAFQELQVTNPETGETLIPSPGQCIAVTVPALMPGMQVYLLYVDPITNMTVKVAVVGVDYENQQVLIDASVPGAFAIVYHI